jgi:ubiquinone/menaquinone biosynthesis C-methylase UbiE
LIESGYEVTGIDISETAAEACAKIYGDKMTVICASADSLPFGDGSFDGAVMIHVIEHLTGKELDDSVSEVYRVLRPNGKLFVRVFHADDMRSDKGERIDHRTVIRGNGIRYCYFGENELRDAFRGFIGTSAERIDERTKFKETRSRIEAVFQKPA